MTRWSAMALGQGMRVAGGADHASLTFLIRHPMDDGRELANYVAHAITMRSEKARVTALTSVRENPGREFPARMHPVPGRSLVSFSKASPNTD